MAARPLALGPLLLVLSACGAEAIPPEAAPAAPETARIEVVTRVSGTGGAQEVRSSGVVDYVRDRSSYVEPTTRCTSITIGKVSYNEVPRGAGLPEGKRWVKSSWDGSDMEADFEQSQKPQQDDDGWTSYTMIGFAFPDPPPREYLDFLRENSGDLERVGQEDVRGVPTTRYRTTLDRKQLTREQLEHEGWKEPNIEKYLETVVETQEEVDLWVDGAGLARRVRTTSSAEFAEVGATHRWVTTREYFDFGVAPAIEAPPASEVIESDEWQRLQERRWREQSEGDEEEAAMPLPQAFDPSVEPSCLH